MVNSDLGGCAKITKALLIIINILFVILGIVLLAVGIWAIVQNQSYAFITGSSVINGGALLIVCGVVTILVNIISIIGALFQLRPFLLVFALVISIIIILELAAAILAFVFGDVVEDQVRDRALEAIGLYRTSPDIDDDFRQDVNDAVDSFQNAFDCCGYTNASDWVEQNVMVVLANRGPPSSCDRCDATTEGCAVYTVTNSTLTFNATTMGCSDPSNTSLRIATYTIGALAIVFGVMEVLGVVLALALCCCITSAKTETVV